MLDLLGWIQLNPKPLVYLNYLVGGLVFGVGMVLAGGCVSGCLYKAGAGNLNSMAGLVGIPVGVMMVEFGPLRTLQASMKSYVIKTVDGGVVTLPKLIGVPYWLLAALTFALTVFFLMRRRDHSKPKKKSSR